MNAAKNMDTIFAQCTADDLDFDVFFDQEDSLIDTVNGVNESGDPLTGSDDFELIHQTEEDVDVDDIRDELGPDNKTDEEIKGAEGTDELDLDKDQAIDNLESNKEVKVDKEDVTDMTEKEIKNESALESVDPAKLLRSLHKAGYTIVKEEGECPECKEEHKDVDDEIDPVSAPSADPSEKETPVSGEVPSDTGSTEDGVKEDKPSEDFSPEGDDEHNSTSTVAECGDVDPEALKAALDKLGYKIVKKDNEPEVEAPAEEEKVEEAPEAEETEGKEDEESTEEVKEEESEEEEKTEDDPALESVDVTKLLESLHKAGYTIVKEEDEEVIDVTGSEEESNEDTVEEEPIVADDDEDDPALESVDVTKLLESLHKAGYTIVKEEDEVIDVKEELEDEIDDDTVEESEDTDSSSIDLSYDISDEDLINAALGK